MKLPESYRNLPGGTMLRFRCGGCAEELEAPPAYAGLEGPCPKCGVMVRAPGGAGGCWTTGGSQPEAVSEAKHAGDKRRGGGLNLPPLNKDTGLVDFPGDFWVEGENMGIAEAAEGQHSVELGGQNVRPPQTTPDVEVQAAPRPMVLPEPRPRVLPTRDEEEAAVIAGERKKEFRLRFFDAALILLFAGTLAMGGAAVAFTQSKRPATPAAPPELSRQVMERMEQMDRQRDQAVGAARESVRRWVTALEPDAVPNCLPGDPVPGIPALAVGNGIAPVDFEFIQARRIPGTERFLTLFEILTDPPMVVPVEETPAGPRLHGRAIVQQQRGSMGKFLASQGQGEAVFYVLLRPGPAPMAEQLVRARPDLQPFLHVAVEPAFPADGASACLACLAPESEAARIFAKRAHDPNLRPAVVKLAWRQHRESGNYIELVDFEPNAWSRH